ncbi:FAD-binding monooxygenase [Brevibacterium sp. BRM-1]|uniref:FAD-binding monooxygenase n=1 Tax=Brevibacterium sp. BRM-1 TaxID=2999062 RepID=UPI00227DB209|nr:FAD-binding monooxygenase [Brevibacterium sp. BRM-1]WAL39797.1 FAD-binding monooxygenase [Brevibacterium sp. BRM-1]
MQFHHHGYVSGEPRVEPAAGLGIDRPEALPETMDVLIVGTGPAGMIAAAQLAQFPTVCTRIIERRPDRLEVGQADGIQARSVETFQAFGFAQRLIAEAYRITEMNFWGPDPADPARIVRTGREVDDPRGVSEFPHLIVNQARVQDYFAQFMADSPARLRPDYGWEFCGLSVADDGRDYPVEVALRRTSGPDAGAERTVRTRYVVGCDGAHSKVRAAIGRTMSGDAANHAWGVMDVLAVTDFPDIRTKCAIQSGAGGSILLIPREGGFLFRMYVDLGEVPLGGSAAVRATGIEDIIAQANRILSPFALDVRDVAWWSVYEVGHRLTDRFDDAEALAGEALDGETSAGQTLDAEAPAGKGVGSDGNGVGSAGPREPRVFITGDACHTHSAKAGQGMNVSMQDGFNIAWKLGHVLTGRADPALLRTYSAERQVVAQNLIDFDREWSSLMAKRPEEFEDPSFLADFYTKTAEFPAGFLTEYAPSLLTGGTEHQALATGFPVGRRFASAPVVRIADANPVHLGHHARADGRFRIYAFADRPGPGEDSRLSRWAQWLAEAPDSPLRAGAAEAFDVKVVYQHPHTDTDISGVPAVFLPRVGPFGLIDYERAYAAGSVPGGEDIFAARGIDRDAGAVVVVRPDQYVAQVLALSDTEALAGYFARLAGRAR